MAIDPATLNVVAKIATTALSDEKVRQAILIACLIPIIILLLVISSPFAIFFAISEGNEKAVSVVNKMYELKEEFQNSIQLEEDANVNEIHTIFMGSEDGGLIDNAEDVLIAYAVKYNVTHENSEQMAILSEDQLGKLEQVYHDMNIMTTSIITVSEDMEVTTINDQGETVTEVQTISRDIKTIYINSLTAEEIAEVYGFDDMQKKVMVEMRQSGYGVLVSTNNVQTFLTRDQIIEIRSHMPDGLTIEKEPLAVMAKSLVGRVNYFWGGKSFVQGWDSRWGTDMKVISLGSSTTGKFRPFGLDCSGYVTWVFVNMGLPSETIELTIGLGTTAQWNASTSIPQRIVELGDLAFLAIPETRKVNHIGIVVGKDDEGNILVAHCTAGANNVVITKADSIGFMYYRRPAVLMD